MPAKKEPEASDADVFMADASVVNTEVGGVDLNDPQIIAFEETRIRMLEGHSETAASFEFQKEDHTLGNSLRYIIMKNPEVEFCGYSIPHPSEELMNIRIQTYEGTTAIDALKKGFNDLMDLCDVVAEKFTAAREEHATRMQS